MWPAPTPGIKAISRLLNLLLVLSLAVGGLSLAATGCCLFAQQKQKFKNMPLKPRKYQHFSTSPCLSNLVHRSLVDKPTSDLQYQTKINGTLPPNAVFQFWPISSTSQCWLSQLTHQILHTNIGRTRRQQSVPPILTETEGTSLVLESSCFVGKEVTLTVLTSYSG